MARYKSARDLYDQTERIYKLADELKKRAIRQGGVGIGGSVTSGYARTQSQKDRINQIEQRVDDAAWARSKQIGKMAIDQGKSVMNTSFDMDKKYSYNKRLGLSVG